MSVLELGISGSVSTKVSCKSFVDCISISVLGGRRCGVQRSVCGLLTSYFNVSITEDKKRQPVSGRVMDIAEYVLSNIMENVVGAKIKLASSRRARYISHKKS